MAKEEECAMGQEIEAKDGVFLDEELRVVVLEMIRVVQQWQLQQKDLIMRIVVEG